LTYVALGVFALLVLAAASTGAAFRPGEWYENLRKPRWTPPDWLFPVAWAVLYLMIAYAGWLVWSVDPFHPALGLWAIQLVANAAWSWLFFGRREMGLAFADLLVMWFSIAGFIVLAWPVSPLAAMLFAPYLVWVSFAGALNFTVWRLNPARS
jgi:benzodiazapine receptor